MNNFSTLKHYSINNYWLDDGMGYKVPINKYSFSRKHNRGFYTNSTFEPPSLSPIGLKLFTLISMFFTFGLSILIIYLIYALFIYLYEFNDIPPFVKNQTHEVITSATSFNMPGNFYITNGGNTTYHYTNPRVTVPIYEKITGTEIENIIHLTKINENINEDITIILYVDGVYYYYARHENDKFFIISIT